MRKDQLLVTTQGIRGGRTHTNKQGNARLTVTKAFNEPQDSIWVDVHPERETALINITFQSGKQFNGTFAQLEKSLSAPEQYYLPEQYNFLKDINAELLEALKATRFRLEKLYNDGLTVKQKTQYTEFERWPAVVKANEAITKAEGK